MVDPTSDSPAPEPSARLIFGARRRRRRLAVLLLFVAAVGVALGLTNPFTRVAADRAGVTDNAYPTSLASVTKQDLSSQTELSGTLGYAGNYTVLCQASNATSGDLGVSNDGETLTWLPAVGEIINQGQPLYAANGIPVVLLYGSTPAYRSLAETSIGVDVAQLNADLVALGYVTHTEIPTRSDDFTWWTKYGVEKLQATLGVKQTGTLTLGQIVFLPTAAKTTSISATLGGTAQVGSSVLTATSTTPQVSIALDPAQQPDVAVGRKVSIVLPNNQTIAGVISSVGTVASTPSGGSNESDSENGGPSSMPTISVLVTPIAKLVPNSWWDEAPVNVTVTTASENDALVVPVDALLALAGGGYAVEVVGSHDIHKLLAVSTGMFDDAKGLVQITSSGLSVGQKVVAPAP